jgi:hypothetical protein
MANLLINDVQTSGTRKIETKFYADMSPEIALMEMFSARIEALRNNAKADVLPIPRSWRRRLANVGDA